MLHLSTGADWRQGGRILDLVENSETGHGVTTVAVMAAETAQIVFGHVIVPGVPRECYMKV